MKQKAALLAAETKKRPPLCHDQCAHCKETRHWRNECPHCRGISKGSKKFSRPSTERYQPEPTVQNLFGLAGTESDKERPGLLILGPREPTVSMKVRGQSLTFMVDTRTEHSVVITPVAPLTGRIATIVGATGDIAACSFCKTHLCQLGSHLVTHEFLYLPECPIPLLGRDLLTKLRTEITFAPRKPASLTLGSQSALMMAMPGPREDEWYLYSLGREQINPSRLLKEFPDVWASGAQVWPETICPL